MICGLPRRIKTPLMQQTRGRLVQNFCENFKKKAGRGGVGSWDTLERDRVNHFGDEKVV
jgi:hypothetical protein